MSTAKKPKKTVHVHGCPRCRVRFEDTCITPAVDELCTTCRGGKAFELLRENAAPKDCCRRSARLVTKDEKNRYSLAGKSVWHICPTCSRTHPYDPKEK